MQQQKPLKHFAIKHTLANESGVVVPSTSVSIALASCRRLWCSSAGLLSAFFSIFAKLNSLVTNKHEV